MAKFNERLKQLRKEFEMSQKQLAQKIGVSKSSVNMYERGEREPGIETLESIADTFNVDMDYLLGKSNIKKRDSLTLMYASSKQFTSAKNIFPIEKKKIPLLGEIACGKPIFASEDRESYVVSGTNINADFCLKALGDSMINARILDGDIVFIKSTSTVNNGEIAAVIIEDEATLKRVYYYPDKGKLVLNPENPAYEPLVYVGEELNQIHILGKAVAFQSDVK